MGETSIMGHGYVGWNSRLDTLQAAFSQHFNEIHKQ